MQKACECLTLLPVWLTLFSNKGWPVTHISSSAEGPLLSCTEHLQQMFSCHAYSTCVPNSSTCSAHSFCDQRFAYHAETLSCQGSCLSRTQQPKQMSPCRAHSTYVPVTATPSTAKGLPLSHTQHPLADVSLPCSQSSAMHKAFSVECLLCHANSIFWPLTCISSSGSLPNITPTLPFCLNFNTAQG